MIACENGNIEIAELLLSHSANVNMQTNNGCSSLMVASRYGHGDVVKTLLDKGAEVNVQNNNGTASLMFASQNGHNDVVKTLLDKGAQVNMQDNDGWTSLMIASQKGHSDTVKVLLDNHANVSIQNKNGSTALRKAIKEGHVDTVKLLATAEQSSSDSPLPHLSPVQQSTIHAISQTGEQYKDVTTPDTISQGALDDGERSPVHNQEKKSRDPRKNSSEPHTLGASNIIPQDYEANKLESSYQGM